MLQCRTHTIPVNTSLEEAYASMVDAGFVFVNNTCPYRLQDPRDIVKIENVVRFRQWHSDDEDEMLDLLGDIAFAKDPSDWPLWPRLPLKRRHGNYFNMQHGLGFYLEKSKPPYVVHVGEKLHQLDGISDELKKQYGKPPTWKQVLEAGNMQRMEYASIEEMLVTWRID